ncbi:D-alanine--D-alanine ligase [Campylobacter sp. FMV-PI01]|uniref:D-alanine--D-alanine ligase n=1 Tax=Campylobacter portucalensis TaxID=2608384 RepID=A0A6L5WKM4_9BACT|nr:D-alanine--D-alanine ligase [Campylobacter portucalensis]MSN96797.1 D-alanine--D-alanine ligase [Campylobacter portucalensis]
MNLGILFGGKSYEHEISIVSAITLKDVFKNNLYFVFCDKDKEFYLIENHNMKASYFSSFEYKKSKKLTIKNGGFFIQGMFSKKIPVDVYINLIHGNDGEDGKIASLFEFFDIKFIGAKIEASVLSYSKILTKYLAKMVGVKTLDYQVLKRGDEINLNFPVILKPAELGSSIGISVVKEQSKLAYSLDNSFEYSKNLLVEPFIDGVKEYNLAGFRLKDEIKFSFIEEPNKKEILDFEQKYLNFSGNSKIKKADITQELEQKIQEEFKKIYNFGFDGAIIRCDFFVIDNEVYLNEINANPGSLAYYLFDDFENLVYELAKNLPNTNNIKINYDYLHLISSNK